MRNTKKVIAATAAVATLVGLAACGSSNDNGANKGDADKAELVFWGWDSTTPAPPRRPPPRSPTPSPQATAPLTS